MQTCNLNKPAPISEQVNRKTDYDVVVIGGAFSGSSTAVLLKRRFPDMKILIVEKAEVFGRRIGESTSEVSACFLTKVLKIGAHLQKHVYKHGLRMWFHREADDAPGTATEVGPKTQGKLPTFQLNRAMLDTELLENAEELGCEIARPATIKHLELGGIGKNKILYKSADGTEREVTAGWVIDASGKSAMIAKMRNTWTPNTEAQPTSSMWCRFTNIRHLDSPESAAMMEEASRCVHSERGFSTNHLMGFGWWAWIIPLNTGEVSVGLMWDKRLFTPPSEGKMSDRLLAHMMKHPVGKVLFENAVPVENDNHYYKDLSYFTEEVTGDGWAIVGDAGGFLDPLYSHGLDFCAHTVYSAYAIIRNHYTDMCVKDMVARRNLEYKNCVMFWFKSIYLNKYWYLGDAQLMFAAFLMDLANYFVGPVRLVYSDQDTEFTHMPYNGKIGATIAKFMAFYNRRLVVMAKKKIAAGTFGDHNLNESYLISDSFTPISRAVGHLLHGMRIWLGLEIRYAFTKPVDETSFEPSMMTPLPKEK